MRRAYAETAEVLIAKQFGTLYMQQDVMEQQRLIEKHGARLGLPNLKASYLRLAGTGPVTTACCPASCTSPAAARRARCCCGTAPGAR